MHTQHYEPRKLRRQIEADIGKVHIQCDQGPPFPRACFNEVRIGLTLRSLIRDRYRIMMSRPEQLSDLYRQVLVNLELHSIASAETSTTRSRASSAA